MFDGGNIQSCSLLAAQNFQFEHLIQSMQIEGRGKCRQGFDAAIVGAKNNVLNLQAGCGGGAIGLDVGDDHSPALREMKSFGHRGSDFLRRRSNLYAVNMAVQSQAPVDKFYDARGDGKAEAFAAAPGRANERVDADDGTVHVNQRSAAIARVYWRISLDVGERLIRIGLASGRADPPHRHRILQTFRTANGED